MRRRKPWNLEHLEERSLLSAMAAHISTDASVYQAGQPIQVTFTETNTTNHAVKVLEAPSFDGFTVEQGGNLVWKSNSGVNPLIVINRVLEPGQSFTLQTIWNGIPNNGSSTGSVATGTFVVFDQLNPGATATFQIVGSSTPPTTTNPPSPIPIKLPTLPITDPVMTMPPQNANPVASPLATTANSADPPKPVILPTLPITDPAMPPPQNATPLATTADSADPPKPVILPTLPITDPAMPPPQNVQPPSPVPDSSDPAPSDNATAAASIGRHSSHFPRKIHHPMLRWGGTIIPKVRMMGHHHHRHHMA